MKRKPKGLPTRERLLETAGRMIAERGVRGTSLRDITAGSKVNNAAVNYHFRTKDDLVRAVVERAFKPVNDARLRALDRAEAEANGAPLAIEAILRALFEPALEAWRNDRTFILIAGRLQGEPDPDLHAYTLSLYEDLVRRYLSAAKRALPEMPEVDLHFWLHFLFGAVVHALISYDDIERLSKGRSIIIDSERFIDRLAAFGAAGLRAVTRYDSMRVDAGFSGPVLEKPR